MLSILFALVVTHAFWFIGRLSDRFHPEPWGRRLVATLAFIAMSALYEWAFLVHSKGQTPGKDIMKLRVVTTGQEAKISTPRALCRWLPLGAAPLLQPLWLMAPALAAAGVSAARRDRRALHDLVAGTRVVAYDRDLEDPDARRPKPRWRRRQEARDQVEAARRRS